MLASQTRIVLVRPRDPNNIGAAARAMKNFGLHDLCIVSPYPPVWQEIVSAVNAEDVLQNARVCNTVAEAVTDCTFVAGTLDPTRVEARQQVYTPMDLSKELSSRNERLAIVFGSEKHGLTNDDLSHCNRLMSIPTRSACPSMNLGQSVAVCCYELTREQAQQAIQAREPENATAGAMEAALHLSMEVLAQIEFILPGNEDELRRRIRAAIMRYGMNAHDVTMFCGILSRIRRGLSSGVEKSGEV